MADSLSSITGVSSGMDWKSLVDQIVQAERRPAARLEAKVTANASRKEALTAFQGTLRKLQAATDGLRFGGAFNQFTVAAPGTAADGSGRAVLAAVGGATAAPGRYAVTVTQLASTQKTVASVGQPSATAALGVAGALTVGGQRVAVAATDSVTDVRDAINAVQAQSGVQATLVAGGADGSDQRLVLTSTRLGAAGAFTVADDPGTVFTPDPAGPNPAPASLTAALGLAAAPRVPARDAMLTVDGVQVTRATNTVADAIPGVTLTLSAAGTTEVGVDRVANAGSDAVKGLVDAYNAVQEAVRAQNTAAKDGTWPALHNDPLLRGLRGPLAAGVVGTASTAGADGVATGVAADLGTLATVGVSLQKDGTLSFDAATFNTASGARLADVRALLADRAQAMADVVNPVATPYLGALDTRQRAIEAQTVSYTNRISDVDARLDKRRTALLAQYAKFEASLGRLKSVGDAMTAQFTAMNKSTS